ncbi:MAG: VOC family protein [Candidatus Neomarinimicrobiota bacterium]
METTLNATAIDHVNMTVKNLDESVSFFQRLFGFETVQDQPEQDSKIIGNGSIKLCLYEDPNLEIGAGINHYGFHVENFDAVVEKCRALGVPMPYDTVDWGRSRSVYIIDPSGYEIELSEVPGGGL